MASAIQFTVFGVPSVYYGDEAGMEGYRDPFCRLPFPWGREDKELAAHYAALGAMRKNHACFKAGDFRFLDCTEHAFLFTRADEKTGDVVFTAANMGTEPYRFSLPVSCKNALTGEKKGEALTLFPEEWIILEKA